MVRSEVYFFSSLLLYLKYCFKYLCKKLRLIPINLEENNEEEKGTHIKEKKTRLNRN